MRSGGKTIAVPGPGGILILSPDFGSPFSPSIEETAAEDPTLEGPPAAPAEGEEGVIIISAPSLGQRPSPAAGGQGVHPFRPLDAYTSALQQPPPQASAATAATRPPEEAHAGTALQAQGSADAPWSARAWRAITSAFRSFLSFFDPPLPPDPHWDRIREPVRQEIAHLRTIGDKKARLAYLHRAGDEVIGRIKQRHGTGEIGFHYNLHGGQAYDFIDAGGIRATGGDIMAGLSVTPSPAAFNDKVYFFSSAHYNLYDILDESNPNLLWFGMFDGRAESSLPAFSFFSRMGHVLIPFRLDSDYLRTAFAEGGAFNRTATSIDFDPRWIRAHNDGKKIGIPASTFLTPPLTVFIGVKQRLGLAKLSRDEETLAVMRYIEAVATWPPVGAEAPAEAPPSAGDPPATAPPR